MLECRDESEMYNYYQIQLSNGHFINRILGGTPVKILSVTTVTLHVVLSVLAVVCLTKIYTFWLDC